MALTNVQSFLLDFVKDGQNFTVIISQLSSITVLIQAYLLQNLKICNHRSRLTSHVPVHIRLRSTLLLATYPFILGCALPCS